MKMDGLTHPKTKELAFTLEIPLPHAIGLLELLWAFVAQQTPQGNIGKWSNQVIAGEAGWQGDADRFVNALISVGFLDENDNHRLLIHDWSDHAPNWVHAKLKKKGRRIISPDLRTDLREAQDPPPEATTSLAKPSQAKGSNKPLGTSQGDAPKDDPDEYTQQFEQLWQSRPRRQGQDNKRKAFKAYRARLREGHTHEEMLAGVKAYKRYLEAEGKAGSKFVQMTATFLGPDKHFADDWSAPASKTQPNMPASARWAQ